MTSIAIQVIAYAAWFCGSLVVYFLLRRRAADPRSVCVLVLGDIGRSPRMMYHAHSLIEHGYIVYLVGYAGATRASAETDDATAAGRPRSDALSPVRHTPH